ncbi:hypothetical protein ABL78_7525 [Leptomonas seymouri]|uniref:Uncharacterized protein n=1 Tax=Leptomonas seymouri TaxID=5684 RepID=A0A0N0P2W6_LEPSE|nr:hypothetical protein ABL78_7525 [Leptomonas seymouri]|eukprot:KPI83439.1 hypothetical protein ABL78_7525 [Leptomonas seymouri]
MLRMDLAYLATAGATTVLSFAHYLTTANSITGQVPIHFNFFGAPDNFAAPWSFVMYPILAVGLSIAAVATTVAPAFKVVLPRNSVEQIATRATLMCSFVSVLGCQLYAARIANGSESKLPPLLLGAVYSCGGVPLVAAFAAKYLR